VSGKKRKSPPNLIRCGDHSWAPYVVTCVHLIQGLPKERWRSVPVRDSREVEFDYICDECYAKKQARDTLTDPLTVLRLVCIHCMREMKNKAGSVDESGT
jgi:hypothetical protein